MRRPGVVASGAGPALAPDHSEVNVANEEWEQELREQLVGWIHDTWDPELTVAQWWAHTAAAGW
jgi:hypothetical protein